LASAGPNKDCRVRVDLGYSCTFGSASMISI
jgi:hypothetical protein